MKKDNGDGDGIIENSSSSSSSNNNNNKKQTAAATATATATTTTMAIKSPVSPAIDTSSENSYHDQKLLYYSWARKDRSGSFVQDMLMAHAYAYSNNQTYAGACACEEERDPGRSHRYSQLRFDGDRLRQHLELIQNTLGLQDTLKLACPWDARTQISKQSGLQPPTVTVTNLNDNPLVWDSCPREYQRPNHPEYRFIHRERDYAHPIMNQAWLKDILSQRKFPTATNPTTNIAAVAPAKVDVTQMGGKEKERSEGNNENKDAKDELFRIAVHMRRGDVDPCQHETRYLPNSYYLQMIQEYVDKYMAAAAAAARAANSNDSATATVANVRVTIYSEQESFEPWDEFLRRNYSLVLGTNDNKSSTVDKRQHHIGSDIAVAWKDMMDADVLILSKSSFSMVPAILKNNNDGSVVYFPFWHAPLEHWVTVNNTVVRETEAEVKKLKRNGCYGQFPRNSKKETQNANLRTAG